MLVRDVKFSAHELGSTADESLDALIKGFDFAYVQPPFYQSLSEDERRRHRVHIFPRVSFNGFHPENIYLTYNGKRSLSPIGAYHSGLVFAAWWHGLTAKEASSLFSSETFTNLRADRFFQTSKRLLMEEGTTAGINLESLFDAWMKAGAPFMLTMNHPAIGPIMDVAKAVLSRDGFAIIDNGILPDHNLLRYPIMPVYPAIAQAHGMRGSELFKRDERLRGGSGFFTIEEFVDASYEAYAPMQRELIGKNPAMSDSYRSAIAKHKDRARRADHPYSSIPAFQSWKKSFSGVAISEVDPVVSSEFTLTAKDKVATAGSCFAQHIAKALSASGLNYYVAETGPKNLGYGIYSARYGNVYTTAQLSQLIDRAYGRFTPVDTAWQTKDGQFADPFRPEMPLADRSSVSAIERQREELFAAVRTMIGEMDYFVFTLGLTEAWRSKIDGAVFPIAPGVAAGEMDADKYEFVNFTVDEVYGDLVASIEKIRAINPRVKFILTVSPVPLKATFEPRHVLQSTTYSKSVLRVAADMATKHDGVHYFPSYEVITGNFNGGAYYEDDLRTVRQEGVDHVMALFLKHCVGVSSRQASRDDDQEVTAIMDNNDILCAEDMINV